LGAVLAPRGNESQHPRPEQVLRCPPSSRLLRS